MERSPGACSRRKACEAGARYENKASIPLSAHIADDRVLLRGRRRATGLATIGWPARREFRIGAASLEIGDLRDQLRRHHSALPWPGDRHVRLPLVPRATLRPALDVALTSRPLRQRCHRVRGARLPTVATPRPRAAESGASHGEGTAGGSGCVDVPDVGVFAYVAGCPERTGEALKPFTIR